ncbi:MAG: LytTR family DNA-binding domain-containing protein, partial [Bacteroidota bacterium]
MQVLRHLIFWVGTLLFLTWAFGQYYGQYVQSFYFFSFLLPVAMATSYFFTDFLMPRYLLQRRFWAFALYFIYTLIISIYLEMLVILASLAILANYNYHEMNPLISDVSVLAITLYLIVFLNALGRLLQLFFSKEQQVSRLEQEKNLLKQKFLTFRADRKQHQVALDQIFYIESLGDYVKIHSPEKHWVTKEKISALQTKLPENFIRIHRSF